MGPVHGELGEQHGTGNLGGELRPLVQTQAPLMAHLDPVVQEADEAECHDGQDRQVPRAREPDLRAEVTDGVPENHAADDGQAAHCGRSGLDAVARRAIRADGLPDALAAEPAQKDRGGENAHPQGNPS